MTVKSILLRVRGLAGFVIRSARLLGEGETQRIEIRLALHGNFKPRCSCCGRIGRVHDKLDERRWHYVPLWNIPVLLYDTPRRVVCPVRSAPTVEAMPWNHGKSSYSLAYMQFLARWARRLSWKETATIFRTSGLIPDKQPVPGYC